MIRKLAAAAALALVAGPLASLYLLCSVDAGASVSLLSEEGGAVFILEVRGFVPLEPLLAAAVL
jgi:hypothetical protein